MSRLNSRPGRSGSLNHIAMFLMVGGLWLVPLAIYVIAVHIPADRETAALTKHPSPTTRVGERMDSGQRQVDVQMQLGAPHSALNQASGTVTSLNTKLLGRHIADGESLYEVNGIAIRASTTGKPYYRALAMGSSGSDVAELNRFLSVLRYPFNAVSGGQTFTTETVVGVRVFQRTAGAPETGIFNPSHVAYLGPDFGALRSFTVGVGDLITPGSKVATGISPANSVRFSPSGNNGDLANIGSSPIKLTVGSDSLAVRSVMPAGDDLARIQEFLSAESSKGAVTETSATGASTVQYSGALISLATPRKFGAVDSAAVYTNPNGRSCIFVLDTNRPNSRESPRPRLLAEPLTPSSEIGVAYVPKELRGLDVVTEPGRLTSSQRAECS